MNALKERLASARVMIEKSRTDTVTLLGGGPPAPPSGGAGASPAPPAYPIWPGPGTCGIPAPPSGGASGPPAPPGGGASGSPAPPGGGASGSPAPPSGGASGPPAPPGGGASGSPAPPGGAAGVSWYGSGGAGGSSSAPRAWAAPSNAGGSSSAPRAWAGSAGGAAQPVDPSRAWASSSSGSQMGDDQPRQLDSHSQGPPKIPKVDMEAIMKNVYEDLKPLMGYQRPSDTLARTPSVSQCIDFVLHHSAKINDRCDTMTRKYKDMTREALLEGIDVYQMVDIMELEQKAGSHPHEIASEEQIHTVHYMICNNDEGKRYDFKGLVGINNVHLWTLCRDNLHFLI